MEKENLLFTVKQWSEVNFVMLEEESKHDTFQAYSIGMLSYVMT